VNKIIADIMAQPADLRLNYALDLIGVLTCDSDTHLIYYREKFNLTISESRLFNYLLVRSPITCTKAQLFFSNWPMDSDTEEKIVDVMISKVRSKTGAKIITIWGTGYKIELREAHKFRVPGDYIKESADLRRLISSYKSPNGYSVNAGKTWDPQDDIKLLRLKSDGVPTLDIARVLGRSERSIISRLIKLKSLGVNGKLPKYSRPFKNKPLK